MQYNWLIILCEFLLYSKMVQFYIYIHTYIRTCIFFFQILFTIRVLQNIESSSLCWLNSRSFWLFIFKCIIVYISIPHSLTHSEVIGKSPWRLKTSFVYLLRGSAGDKGRNDVADCSSRPLMLLLLIQCPLLIKLGHGRGWLSYFLPDTLSFMGNNKISFLKDGNSEDKCGLINNEVKCLKMLLKKRNLQLFY